MLEINSVREHFAKDGKMSECEHGRESRTVPVIMLSITNN